MPLWYNERSSLKINKRQTPRETEEPIRRGKLIINYQQEIRLMKEYNPLEIARKEFPNQKIGRPQKTNTPGVVSHLIENAGELSGSVFCWRGKKNRFANHIPTALCIPFQNSETAKWYVSAAVQAGFEVREIRKGKRTNAPIEIKMVFSMKAEASYVVGLLVHHGFHKILENSIPF